MTEKQKTIARMAEKMFKVKVAKASSAYGNSVDLYDKDDEHIGTVFCDVAQGKRYMHFKLFRCVERIGASLEERKKAAVPLQKAIDKLGIEGKVLVKKSDPGHLWYSNKRHVTVVLPYGWPWRS